MFTVLKNAKVFAPKDLGRADILICGSRIVAIEKDLAVSGLPECTVIDASARIATPGIVDGHVHLTGGGGEGGFATRTPEVKVETLCTHGVCTVAGLLGTDTLGRHPETLLAKVNGLRAEGVSAYMFTGGYCWPSPTVMGAVDRDIAFIDAVIGAKIAITDHRSSQMTAQELSRLTSLARVGGMIGGKAGRVVAHLGAGKAGFGLLHEVIETTDIPIGQFIPTHVNRNEALFDQAYAWLSAGGHIDFTSGINRKAKPGGAVKPSVGIAQCFRDDIGFDRVTMTSDGNGSAPIFDAGGTCIGIGIGGFEGMLQETRDLVGIEGLPLEQALRPVTSSAATVLGLGDKKGHLAVGADADILLLDEDLAIDHVFARGQHMVRQGDPIVFGAFSRG